jgi:hypothetical protein
VIATEVEVFDSGPENVSDTKLRNSEKVIVENEKGFAEAGSSVSQESEPLLAHRSEYRSPDHFMGYLNADERKRQSGRNKLTIIATSTPEKKAVMKKALKSEK